MPHPSPALEKRICIRGELALCIGVILNSFAVRLMLYSGSGISAIASVPYIISEIFPVLSLGTWNYLFQTVLVVALMLLRRKFVPSYLLAFLVGFAFGVMMDVHTLWITQLPLTLALRVVYFIISFLSVVVGITLSNHCKLPIIPTDLFPRELANILNKPYKKIKTAFDLSCLTVTVVLSLVFLREIRGIGIGTVFCALATGWAVSRCSRWLERRFTFVSFLAP